MLKYIKTKNGKTYQSYTDTHHEIMVTNHLSREDIVEEGIIDRGIRYLVTRKKVALPKKL